jgi:hypothetical protein
MLVTLFIIYLLIYLLNDLIKLLYGHKELYLIKLRFYTFYNFI